MLGGLISLLLGGYAAGSAACGHINSNSKREKARREGEQYYYDSNHKMRSVRTNEIVTLIFYDPHYHGHQTLIASASDRLIHDYTLEALEKENQKLKEEGKKFIWKEYENIHEKGKNACTFKSCFFPYDPEKKLAFRIDLIPHYDLKKYPGKRYKKTYLKEESWGLTSTGKVEYLSVEEEQPWHCILNKKSF